MRRRPSLKLDEDVASHFLTAGLVQAGYTVDTVVDEGLSGAADDEVLFAAAAADRVLIARDKGHGDRARPVPQSCPGVVRLQLPLEGPEGWLRRLLEVLPGIEVFTDMLHIITPTALRSVPLQGIRTSR